MSNEDARKCHSSAKNVSFCQDFEYSSILLMKTSFWGKRINQQGKDKKMMNHRQDRMYALIPPVIC